MATKITYTQQGDYLLCLANGGVAIEIRLVLRNVPLINFYSKYIDRLIISSYNKANDY